MKTEITYICKGEEITINADDLVESQHKGYDEHAAMHYDCSGWYNYSTYEWIVNKCPNCGKKHEISKQHENVD